MGYCAYTVDSDFRIEAGLLPAALAAVNAEVGGEFASLRDAVHELTCFQDCELDEAGAFVLGRHADKYIQATEDLLGVLGRFAVEGSYVRFDGEDGSLFGFRVVEGQWCPEHGEYAWTMDERQRPAGGAVGSCGGPAPLVFSRDRALYEAWWASTDREEIDVALADLRAADLADTAWALHALVLAVFQHQSVPVTWLHVDGLRESVSVRYLMLDIDPSYGCDGELNGVEVVLNLWIDAEAADWDSNSLMVLVYVDRPWQQFAVPGDLAPCAALAEIIDRALSLINAEVASRDRFIVAARELQG